MAELEALYRRRYEPLVRVAAGVTGDVERGRDVVQSAFVTAVRTRRSFRGDGPLEAWLWRIVVNEATRCRRPRQEVELEDDVAIETANDAGADEMGLRAWIAHLPGRQRAVVFRRYFADLDYRSWSTEKRVARAARAGAGREPASAP